MKSIKHWIMTIGTALSLFTIMVLALAYVGGTFQIRFPNILHVMTLLGFFYIGPLTCVFAAPATYFAIRIRSSALARFTVTGINGLGLIISLYSLVTVIAWWRMGGINPG